jgi:hypothetical protein
MGADCSGSGNNVLQFSLNGLFCSNSRQGCFATVQRQKMTLERQDPKEKPPGGGFV